MELLPGCLDSGCWGSGCLDLCVPKATRSLPRHLAAAQGCRLAGEVHRALRRSWDGPAGRLGVRASDHQGLAKPDSVISLWQPRHRAMEITYFRKMGTHLPLREECGLIAKLSQFLYLAIY